MSLSFCKFLSLLLSFCSLSLSLSHYSFHLFFFFSLLSPLSDVSEKDLSHYIYVAVWDWDRIGSNDFIGGMGLKISDIITETCEGQRIESWYKLLADNISRKKSIRIISDEEAEKVRSFKSIANAHTHMYTYIHVHNYTVLVACTSVTIVFILGSQGGKY